MRKILFAFLLCLVTLTATAENTILILGDSLSAGYGIERQQAWPALLEKRLQEEKYNYRLINASISGDTTSDGLSRLPVALKKYHPNIIIIELGANDGLRGLQIETINNNLNSLITLAQKSGGKVLVLGIRLPPNYGPAYTEAFQQIFVNLAKHSNTEVIPDFLKAIDPYSNYFQEDRLHPRASAQLAILNTIWPVLQSMLIK